MTEYILAKSDFQGLTREDLWKALRDKYSNASSKVFGKCLIITKFSFLVKLKNGCYTLSKGYREKLLKKAEKGKD